GVGRANKVARRVCGLADGAKSAELLAALKAREAKAIINAVCDERLRFLKGLSTWSTFGPGWSRRVAEVRGAAVAMAAMPISTVRTDIVVAAPPAPPHDTNSDGSTIGHDPGQGKAIVPPPPAKQSVQLAGGVGAALFAALAYLRAHPAD